MDLQLIGSKKKKIEAPDTIFGCEYNEPLIHQVVTAYFAAGRAGTQAQKNRAAVSGGGSKPWKQKGSGRARAGTTRSPIWRKGGVTFAAQPRSYKQKINRKMYRAAIRSMFSELVRLERLKVVEAFELPEIKTKALLAKLLEFNLTGNILLIAESVDRNLFLSARNVPHLNVIDAEAINPACLIKADYVICTVSSLKQVEESLK